VGDSQCILLFKVKLGNFWQLLMNLRFGVVLSEVRTFSILLLEMDDIVDFNIWILIYFNYLRHLISCMSMIILNTIFFPLSVCVSVRCHLG
jgi:hypothetical protein